MGDEGGLIVNKLTTTSATLKISSPLDLTIFKVFIEDDLVMVFSMFVLYPTC